MPGILQTDNYETLRERPDVMSEAADEIISRRPSFAAKWALVLFLLILLLLIGSTWFIRYPDIIEVRAALMESSAPKDIIPRQEGKIVKVLCENEGHVKKDEAVAWIESIASHHEVILLHVAVSTAGRLLTERRTGKIPAIFENLQLRSLGELQSGYQQLMRAFQQFRDYLPGGYHSRRMEWIKGDYRNLTEMHQQIQRQIDLARQDLRLTEQEYAANEKLFGEKVIAAQEMRNSESRMVGKRQLIPQLESSLLANESLQLSRKRELGEIEHELSLQHTIFEQELSTFQTSIDDWRRRFMMLAPATGKVTFNVPLQEGYAVQPGKTIGYVRSDPGKSYMQVHLAQASFGKIEVGQTVLLRLDAFPYQEYGVLSGKIAYISNVAHDSAYLANIELLNGLTTNAGIKIHYSNGLKAQALIITRNERMMMKFFNNIMKGVQR